MSTKLLIKEVAVEQVYPLRNKILRPNQPLTACHYMEDKLSGVFHLAAFDQQQAVIGIASFYPQNSEQLMSAEDKHIKLQFRLRGMAVDSSFQGQGIGCELVNVALKICQQAGAGLLWCNARSSALGFYQKLGFVSQGDAFELAGIGEHYLLSKQLE